MTASSTTIVAYSVILGAAITVDAEYSGLDPADIAVVNLEQRRRRVYVFRRFGSGTINAPGSTVRSRKRWSI